MAFCYSEMTSENEQFGGRISINIADQHVLSILYCLQLLAVALNFPLTLMIGIGYEISVLCMASICYKLSS